jgi:hypothetical protein
VALYVIRLNQHIMDGIKRAAKTERRSQTGLMNDIFDRWLSDWSRCHHVVHGAEDTWRSQSERLRKENARLKAALREMAAWTEELLNVVACS